MRRARLILAALVGGAGLLIAAPALVPDAAGAQTGEAAASRFERLRTETTNVALQKIPPFRVFDNLYYVGIGHLSSWLVTTSDGLILIDALQDPYVDHLIASIRTLGFNPADIRYLLITHAHVDHYGGAAYIQETYAPRVGMTEGDWQFLASNPPTRPGVRVPRRDVVFKSGDSLTVGDTTLRFHALPGHTPGGLSIEQTVYDQGKPHKAFTLGGVTPARGVEPVKQFLTALRRIEQIDGIEVNIPNHPWRGEVLQRAERLAQRRSGEPHPFVDPGAWTALLRDLRSEAEQRLKDEAR
jgi:metallo-beta-lactamase class B